MLNRDGNRFEERDGCEPDLRLTEVVRRLEAEVAECKKTEAALREIEALLRIREERLRRVSETMSDFIWEVDAEGVYRYISPSVENILGYTPEELVGKRAFHDLFDPRVREQLKAAMFQLFAAGKPFRAFPASMLSKTGNIVYLEMNGSPQLDDAGYLLGYSGADADITERRRAEIDAVVLQAEMASFSRIATTGEIAAYVAHEMSQPLAAILSNAEAALLLLDTHAPDLSQLREILEDIASDDRRAGDVLHHLRSPLRKHDLKRQILDVNSLLHEMFLMIEGEALHCQISIVMDLESQLPKVKGDRVMLLQAFLNLGMNACQAMADTPEHQGNLLVRTRKARNSMVQVDFVDSGPHIPPDGLGSIFDFSVKSQERQSRIGLSLSRTIATVHGGRLWAENNTDRGVTFHLLLPATGSTE
jgi:PAS domain S-box-containing protein